MAFVKADLEVIERAMVDLAAGRRVSELRFADRSIRRDAATLADLMRLRADIREELSRVVKRSRVVRIYGGGKGIL